MFDSDGAESEAQEIDFDVAERREMDASAGDGYHDDDDDTLREMINDEGPQMSDVEADADTLASAGMGTDEDYGYFGNDEGF
jgi:hypothetical protein